MKNCLIIFIFVFWSPSRAFLATTLEMGSDRGWANPPWCSEKGEITGIMPFCIPRDYQKHVPPFQYINSIKNFQSPMELIVMINLRDIIEIYDPKMTLTLDLWLDLYWKEPRIVLTDNETIWEKAKPINVDPAITEYLWIPDFDIYHMAEFELKTVLGNLGSMDVHPDKTLALSLGASVSVSCEEFNFWAFPLDEQVCKFLYGSYGYQDYQLIVNGSFMWQRSPNSLFHRPLQYMVTAHDLDPQLNETTYIEYDKEGHPDYIFSVAGIKFRLYRLFFPYCLRYYLPSTLLVCISWISFLIPTEALAGRIAVLITVLLMLINVSIGVTADLPPCNVMTALELWIQACVGFVFLALVELAVILITNESKKKCQVSSSGPAVGVCRAPLDRMAIIAFPGIFVLSAIVYFSVYIQRNDVN